LIRWRVLGAGLAISAVLGQVMSAIPALAATPTGPAVIQSLKNDTSGPLRTMQASPIAPSGKGNQPYRLLHPGLSGTKLPTAPNSIQTSAGAAAMPSTTTNFEGIGNIDGVLPPDTNGDVGPNNYVQWVNLHFEIFDRGGTSLLPPKAGNTLWSGFGGLCEFTNQGDPVVRYDRMADRWIFTQFAFNTRGGLPIAPFDQCFAVSTTGDPTGSYFRNTFVGAGALAFDRTKMLAGQPAGGVGFGPLGASFGVLLPSDLDGSILPPSGSPNYFGAIDTSVSPSGSSFQIWKFHVDFATPANSTFGTASNTPNFRLTVDTYFWNMCPNTRSCIQQPGTSQGLDAISDRLMNRLQYRRFADGHESLVANHTVGAGSGNNQTAVRWYEIRNLSTTPTIYQQSTYAPSADSRWMGSIAMDQSGDIALGYSVSSFNVSPSIRYTGRLAGDPLGTLPQGEATLIPGSGSQTSSFNRWGDYSMMAVDPTDDCTFWYTQEYYAATSTAGWQTRVGSFKFPGCGPPQYVVGVVDTNGGLRVKRAGSPEFTSLGGTLIAAPAVVSIPQPTGPPLYVYLATGTDHDLWVRNDSIGWKPLTSTPFYCIDSPAGTVAGTTLYVACEGSDHALWHVETAAPVGNALPTTSASAWQSLGGILTAGPAVSLVGGTPTYFVVGTGGQFYFRTLTSGYTFRSWICVGHPAASTSGSLTYFACHGTDGTLWFARNDGSGWSAATSLGGILTDGPGVAATPTGPYFFVEGSGRDVFQRTIATDWISVGGVVSFGASAAS
jgi:hypothetical protein